MLTANVFDRVAYLMDNAELDTCIGEYALYSIRETFQTINTAYQYASLGEDQYASSSNGFETSAKVFLYLKATIDNQ